jgi:hypothetical protein
MSGRKWTAALRSDESPSPDAELPIGCALHAEGLRAQRDRYRRLGVSAERVVCGKQALTVEFGTTVDAALVAEALAVERACCPFFDLRYDPLARRLTATVSEPAHDPALDALRDALLR